MTELLGPAEIRQLADKLGVVPTKKLGQNFVHDPNTVRGSLTLELLDKAGRVTAVEIDDRLAAELPHTVEWRAPEHADKLRVLNKDALKIEASDLPGGPTALVANLPYNVSVPVLLHFLATFPTIRRVLVMVQLEVAERLAAAPGSKVYGVPSVKAAFYGKVSLAGKIGKNVFWPAPNIESGLVAIDCYTPEDAPWPITPELRELLFPPSSPRLS